MNAAAWGLVILVVLPLLQLPLIVYLSRRIETDEASPPPAGWGDGVYPPDPNASRSADPESSRSSMSERSPPSRSSALSTPSDPSAPSVVVCRRCSADNDPAFTYCHDCVARL